MWYITGANNTDTKELKDQMKAHKVELNIKQKQQPSGVAESTAVWKNY